MSSGSEGGSAITGKSSSSGVKVASTSANEGVLLTGSTMRRSSSRWMMTSSAESSNSRGIRRAWFRPFRKRRAWRTDSVLSNSRLDICLAYATASSVVKRLVLKSLPPRQCTDSSRPATMNVKQGEFSSPPPASPPSSVTRRSLPCYDRLSFNDGPVHADLASEGSSLAKYGKGAKCSVAISQDRLKGLPELLQGGTSASSSTESPIARSSPRRRFPSGLGSRWNRRYQCPRRSRLGWCL